MITIDGVDKETVNAFRESDKIDDFLRAMVAQRRMTAFEQQIVNQEGHEVYRQAGYLDQHGRHSADYGDEGAAVERQANHQMKRKIVEFHPELEGELNRFIEHRPHHPLPPVPSGLARSGAALAQYRGLIDYVERKREEGVIKHEEAHAMYAPAIEVFTDSGVDYGELSDRTDKAVLAQAHHLMKKTLMEIHPELASEVRNLGRTRSK